MTASWASLNFDFFVEHLKERCQNALLLGCPRSAKGYAQILLSKKRAASETELEPPIAFIRAFIKAELERLEGIDILKDAASDRITLLNGIFHHSLAEGWT
jgi:hypothetical protein